jgi:hypothetical protein
MQRTQRIHRKGGISLFFRAIYIRPGRTVDHNIRPQIADPLDNPRLANIGITAPPKGKRMLRATGSLDSAPQLSMRAHH